MSDKQLFDDLDNIIANSAILEKSIPKEFDYDRAIKAIKKMGYALAPLRKSKNHRTFVKPKDDGGEIQMYIPHKHIGGLKIGTLKKELEKEGIENWGKFLALYSEKVVDDNSEKEIDVII